MKLIASLIVRNEMARYLAECVPALLEFCDEVRVIDDGSTDGTARYLAGLGAAVQAEHLPAGTFFDHEGRARQALLDWTLRGNPTHILAVDADEFVSDGWAIRRFCEGGKDVGTLRMEEVWELDGDCVCVRTDGGWRPHPVPILYRVPEKRIKSEWRIPDRALACGREPGYVKTRTRGAVATGADVLHFGWANESERKARHDRYVVADGGRFHTSSHLDSIMWPAEKILLDGRPWPESLFRRRVEIAARVRQPSRIA